MAIGIIANDKTNKLHLNKKNKYYDSTFKVSLNDTNESHAIIASNIKPGATVLDIGCAQGIIGEAIHKSNCKIYGIEIDEEAIKIARKTNYYQEIYNFDISDKKSKLYQEFFNTSITFDYILFSDVLEHLLFPDEILYEFSKKLSPNGSILISLPNVAHYDVVDGLLNEKFNYSEMGILDNTHLRFFTKYSFAEYIKTLNDDEGLTNCKFDLEVIGRTIIKPEFYEDYKCLSEIISKNEQLLVLQNIFKLTKIDQQAEAINLERILLENRVNITKTINDELVINQKKIDESQLEIQELKEKVELLKNQNETLKKNSTSLQKQLDLIYNSRSWKITEPARQVMKKVKKSNAEKNNHSIYEKSILYVVQSWVDINNPNNTHIGGTTLHVLELVSHLKDKYNIYILTAIDNEYVLITFENGEQIIHSLGLQVKIYRYDCYHYEFLYMINNLIDTLQIDLVHIQHIINFPCDLQYISKKTRVILTLHDYTILCPNYFLIDQEKKYCQEAGTKKCLKCSRGIYIETRNNAVNNLLKSVDKITVPDASVITEVKKYYNYDKFIIVPNGIEPSTFSKFDYCDKIPKKIKNIAFIGGLNIHKGSHLAKQIIKNNDENIMYHLFGTSNDKFFLKNYKNYIYHGEYKKKQLPKLLNDNHIDVVLMLSICPETFSYVLSETVYAKVPVIALDVGAIGNRVKEMDVGIVLDSNSDYKKIISAIKEILKKQNYNKYIKNLQLAEVPQLKEMIISIEKLYDCIVPEGTDKNDDLINKFLRKLKIKYKIKRTE